MGYIKLTVSLMLIALFSISIIVFATNFAADNDAGVNLGDDDDFPNINSNLQDDVDEFYQAANTSSSAFQESTVSSQTESSEGGTQFKVTPVTSLAMARRAITAGWKKIFGADSSFNILFTALLGLLGFILAAYAYKAWVGRNPD